MPEYLSPGVYVEEIDAGPKPIEGVSTSTAGAVGVTRRGPSRGKPELVTSFAEFQRKFGGFLDAPSQSVVNKYALDASEGGRWWLFPHSVKGFFDNGGQRLYVKRVFPKDDAKESKVDLGTGVIAELTADAAASVDKIRVRHHFGLQNGVTVKLFASGVPLAANPFTVNTYESNGTLHLNKAVGSELKSGRDWVEVVERKAPAAGPPDTRTLTVKATSVGEWGNDLQVRVRPVTGATVRILGDSLLASNGGQTTTIPGGAAAAATTVTLAAAALPNFAVGHHVRIENNVYEITGTNGNDIDIDPAVPAAGFPPNASVTRLRAGQVNVAADAIAGATTLEVDALTGFIAGDHALIDGSEYLLTSPTTVPGPPVKRTFTVTPGLRSAVDAGTPVVRLASANDTGVAAKSLNVQTPSSLYKGAIVELDNGTAKERTFVESITGQKVKFDALTGTYYEGHNIRVIEAEVGVQYLPGGVLQATETYLNLRLIDDGTPSYIIRNVNSQSKYIELAELQSPLPTAFDSFPSVPPPTAGGSQLHWARLENGADNLDKLKPEDFIGEDLGSGKRSGIAALEDIDEISICVVPDVWSSSVQNALILHCETLKDRFAILDPRDGRTIEEIREIREKIDTKYAALYYPWLVVRDPVSGTNIEVAPSAHMAGIYARVDVERGVHKAPANEVVRNIIRFAQDVTKREQDMLNPKGINALRYFPGRGYRVWGARVATSDADWKYINVRRLFIYVEESIDEGTQWVVFEPNDEPLWARVRQTIDAFLTRVWRDGALQGVTAKEAFFVRCDRSTMTQDDIDNGRLICVIGIAPVKPAEFVIFRIQQFKNPPAE